jgi:hypothetical protein
MMKIVDKEWRGQGEENGKRLADKEEKRKGEKRGEDRQIRCDVDRKRRGMKKTVRKLVEGTGRAGR